MKEILVSVTLKNNILLEKMRERGIENASRLSKITGFSPSDIGELINLKKGVIFTKKGVYTKICKKLALFFCVLTEDLFPGKLYEIEKTRAETTINYEQLNIASENSDPFEIVQKKLLLEGLNSAMQQLSEREKDILNRRSNGETLDAIGGIYGICRQCVRTIEVRALCKMRKPSVLKLYKDYAESFGYN